MVKFKTTMIPQINKDSKIEKSAQLRLNQKKKVSIIQSLHEDPHVANQFTSRLYDTLKYLYNKKSELLIYGNINIDYQMKTGKKHLNSLLIN
jgi:hypothetical protein